MALARRGGKCGFGRAIRVLLGANPPKLRAVVFLEMAEYALPGGG